MCSGRVKSRPPVARSSGGRVATPLSQTRRDSAASPAKSSKKSTPRERAAAPTGCGERAKFAISTRCGLRWCTVAHGGRREAATLGGGAEPAPPTVTAAGAGANNCRVAARPRNSSSLERRATRRAAPGDSERLSLVAGSPERRGEGARAAPAHFLGRAPVGGFLVQDSPRWGPKHHSHWCARSPWQGWEQPSFARFQFQQISTPCRFLRYGLAAGGAWEGVCRPLPPPPLCEGPCGVPPRLFLLREGAD